MSRKHLLVPMIDREAFEVQGVVEKYPGDDGWYFVRVPKEYTEATKDVADRGLVAIVARVGDSEWKTSLLPYGDGTQFVALNVKVRKKEGIELGDRVRLVFWLRER